MKYLQLQVYLLTILLFAVGCHSNHQQLDQYSYELGVVGAFSEVINAGVKELALSAPMEPKEMDAFIEAARETAAKHNVFVYRESSLMVSDLFPPDVAVGKDVLLLYQGQTLEKYLTLKADKEKLEQEDKYQENSETRRDIARRFGRLLSYSPRKINDLLSQNTPFRTMTDFGIRATNLFLYYKDLKRAGEFYSKTLGLEIVADYEMALILRMTADSYLILVDATKGMHTADEPKSVALAFLTEQLDEWWKYLKSQNVEIKYDYKPKEGSAHDGFVAVDPEGYLLEFEAFNQHPENEGFIPLLNQNKEIAVESDHDKTVPAGLNFHSTITWLYYDDVLKMEGFYEDVLGFEMVADQGWTKIYKVSNTGFMAIVDGRRGMNKAAETKAVNVGFIIDELTPWFEYVKEYKPFPLRDDELSTGPENRYKAFVGYGPEDYYLEFDRFFPHEDNTKLMEYLEREK